MENHKKCIPNFNFMASMHQPKYTNGEFIMIKKRGHHYVWQDYLREWSTNDQIWCLRHGSLFKVNTKKIVKERDFYKLQELTLQEISLLEMMSEDFGGKLAYETNLLWVSTLTAIPLLKNEIKKSPVYTKEVDEKIDLLIHNMDEDIHCSIENDAIEIIKAIINEDSSILIDPTQLTKFIFFITTQYTRTKKFKSVDKSQLKLPSNVKIESIWNIVCRIVSTALCVKICKNINQWNTVIIKNSTNINFITTDQPVLNTCVVHGNSLENHEHIELYYPLSPKIAFLLTRDARYNNKDHISVNESDVNRYNSAMIEFSHENVFSCAKEDLQTLLMNGSDGK